MRGAQRASPLVVQAALLVAVAFSELTIPLWILVLVGVTVMLSSVAALRFRLSVAAPFIGCYIVIGLYFSAVADPTEPLLGMLVTLTSWTVAVPIMLLGPITGPLVSGSLALAYSAGIAVLHPGWEPRIPLMLLAFCVLVGLGSAVLIWQFRRFAQAIDEQERNVGAERARAVRARAMSEATAEYTSVLHDTIVNTFGALARSGSADFDPASVRERCRRDLERLRVFLRDSPEPIARASLRDLELVGLPVHWVGITGDDLKRYEALLPVAVTRALLGCATEAVLNATKHSGATGVVCEVSYEADEFVLQISDDGAGFELDAVSERGIAHSIRARAERSGIRVRIDTAPGEGTRVRLVYTLSDGLLDRDDAYATNAERMIRAFTARVGMTWATVVTAIGLTSITMNTVDHGVRPWIALAAILVITAMSWLIYRPTADAPHWFVASILVATPLTNLLLFAEESRIGGMFFPTLALTALPMLLLMMRSNPVWFFVSVGMQIATVVGVVAWGAPRGRVDILSVLLLEAPVLAMLSITFAFVRLVGVVGGHLAETNARAADLERRAVRLEAERNVRVQWSASALDAPLSLLQSLADGSLSCADPEVRARCATEEAYLRQLSAVPAHGGPMSWWFALAIAESRRRSVTLLLDTEHAEVTAPRDARALGEIILACVARAAAGEELRVSMMRQQDSVVLLVVGASEELMDLETHRTADGLRIECRKLASQVLVESRLDGIVAAAPH